MHYELDLRDQGVTPPESFFCRRARSRPAVDAVVGMPLFEVPLSYLDGPFKGIRSEKVVVVPEEVVVIGDDNEPGVSRATELANLVAEVLGSSVQGKKGCPIRSACKDPRALGSRHGGTRTGQALIWLAMRPSLCIARPAFARKCDASKHLVPRTRSADRTRPHDLAPANRHARRAHRGGVHKFLTLILDIGTMSASSPAEPVARGVETGKAQTSVTIQARYMGAAILVLAASLAFAAVYVGVLWTAPAAGPCFPPSGGQSIPCPSGELTPNNLFTLLVLVISSLIFFVLGIVVLMLVWFRAHPTD